MRRRQRFPPSVDMHTKDARAIGETEQRIFALPAWKETHVFTA